MPLVGPPERATAAARSVGRGSLRSPLARALVPVLGGIGVLALIFLATWAMAAFISRGGASSTERLAPATFRVGTVDAIADVVAEEGPILFPGLDTTTGERTLVLDHDGGDPRRGWRVYYAFPADQGDTCAVTQVEGTSRFVDCGGRTIDVTDLAPPAGIYPLVEDRTLSIDLREATASSLSG